MSEKLKVVCPCCSTDMVVDPETGAVLSHEVPRAAKKSFEDAFSAEKGRRARTEERFGRVFRQQEKRQDILAKKFEEAKKKAEESDKDYRNPLDYD
jgi:hypothetical protein